MSTRGRKTVEVVFPEESFGVETLVKSLGLSRPTVIKNIKAALKKNVIKILTRERGLNGRPRTIYTTTVKKPLPEGVTPVAEPVNSLIAEMPALASVLDPAKELSDPPQS